VNVILAGRAAEEEAEEEAGSSGTEEESEEEEAEEDADWDFEDFSLYRDSEEDSDEEFDDEEEDSEENSEEEDDDDNPTTAGAPDQPAGGQEAGPAPGTGSQEAPQEDREGPLQQAQRGGRQAPAKQRQGLEAAIKPGQFDELRSPMEEQTVPEGPGQTEPEGQEAQQATEGGAAQGSSPYTRPVPGSVTAETQQLAEEDARLEEDTRLDPGSGTAEQETFKQKDAQEAGEAPGPKGQRAESLQEGGATQGPERRPTGPTAESKAKKEGPGRKNNTSSEQCMYFGSAKGCRFGADCRSKHEDPTFVGPCKYQAHGQVFLPPHGPGQAQKGEAQRRERSRGGSCGKGSGEEIRC
jgi:hypothetical protein